MEAGDAKEFVGEEQIKEEGKANPVMWLMNIFLSDKPYFDSNEHESRHHKKMK